MLKYENDRSEIQGVGGVLHLICFLHNKTVQQR